MYTQGPGSERDESVFTNYSEEHYCSKTQNLVVLSLKVQIVTSLFTHVLLWTVSQIYQIIFCGLVLKTQKKFISMVLHSKLNRAENREERRYVFSNRGIITVLEQCKYYLHTVFSITVKM